MKHTFTTATKIVFTILLVFSIVCTNAQTFQWAKVGGEPGGAVGNNIAVDAQGNSYVTGYFLSTADFDGIVHTSDGGQDIYVAKYNTNGVIQWVLKAGGIGDDAGNDISLDASGNIYITGKFRDTATFGSFTLISSGNTDVFVAKCNSAGQWLWAIKGGSTDWDEGYAISTDNAGNSYITGYIRGTSTFGNSIVNVYSGASDILIAKCNSNGTWIWASHAGGISWDSGQGISVDGSGNIYITGYFTDGYIAEYYGHPVYFGSQVLYPSAGGNMFIAKYDSTGDCIWAIQGGGPGVANGTDIASDIYGNSYVLGIFYDTASFNGVTLIAVAPEGSWWIDDYFFAKYDSNGNLKWIHQLGGAGYFKGNGVTLGTEGEVFITGTFDGTVTIIDTTLTSSGYDNMYVALFDTAGTFYWVKKADGNYYHATMGISDGTGNAYITGFFHGTATFNCTTFSTITSGNMFITKLNDFLHTGTIAQTGFCPGETVMVPFTSEKPCNPQNVYAAQLSDITGCFNNPVNIGTLNDYGTGGVITAAIPQNTTNGTAYRIRVISSDPLIIGADNGTNLTIYPLPVAEAGPDTTINPGESVTLGSAPVAGYLYSWLPTTGLSDPAIANPVANPTTTTTYYLTVTDLTNGCSDWDSVRANVYIECPTYYHIAGSDIQISLGDSTVIGTTAIPGYTYSWSPSIGLSDTTISQPVAKPNETHEYTIKVTSPEGCIIKDKIIVQIKKPLLVDMGPKEYRDSILYSNIILIKTIDENVILINTSNQKYYGTSYIATNCYSLKNIFDNYVIKYEGNKDSVIFIRSNLDSYINDNRCKNIFTVIFPVMVNIDSIITDLKNNQYIADANPPYTALLLQDDGVPYYETDFSEILYSLWHIEQIQARNAWVFLQNLPSSASQEVGIIDWGIADHYEFHNPDRITNYTNQCGSDNIHSTQVASIIVSNPAAGWGTISVGYNLPMLTTHDIQCISPPNTPISPYEEFLSTNTQNGHHPRFLNLSFAFLGWGKPSCVPYSLSTSTYHSCSIILNNCIGPMIDDGVMIFASGGNATTSSGDGICNPRIGYPFGYPGVIGVGATTLSSFNTSLDPIGEYGRGGPGSDSYNCNFIAPGLVGTVDFNYQLSGYIDIVAPGKKIFVATHTSNNPDTYTYLGGTSLSSPIVATIASCLASVYPNITNQKIEDILYSSADKVNYNPLGTGITGPPVYIFPISEGNSYSNLGSQDLDNDGVQDGFSDINLDYIMGYGRVNMLSAIMNAAGLNPGGFTIDNSFLNRHIAVHNKNDQFYQIDKVYFPPTPYNYNLNYDYDAILNQFGARITLKDAGTIFELKANSTFKVNGGATMQIQDCAELKFESGTTNTTLTIPPPNYPQEFTKYVIGSLGTLNLKNTTVKVPAYSILEVDENGILNLDNAEIIIEENGYLLIKNMASVNLTNNSKIIILCNGQYCVDPGASIYADLNSSINFYSSAISGIFYPNTVLNPVYFGSAYPPNCSSTITLTSGSTGTVNYNASVDATFTYDADNLCMGTEINFQSSAHNDCPAFTYNWNFGDGTTSTDANPPPHIYTTPGYYQVSLNVSTEYIDEYGNIVICDNACSTQIISIVPKTANYNINCCSENITYSDIGIPNLIYDNNGNYTVGTTANINTGTYKIKGTVTVMPGATLNINTGAVVEFGPYGKIIVMRGNPHNAGGILNLNACELKGLSDCNTMWQGIEVWGDASLSQVSDKQGKVKFLYAHGPSIISDAHVGVLLGKTKLCFPNSCYPCKKGQYDLNYSGGIINAVSSEFNNNAIGVKFMPYKYYNSSKILNCDFNGGTLLDPGYFTGNSYVYNGSNIHNPYYPKANSLKLSVFGLHLWDVRFSINPNYIYFDGNNFNNMVIAVESFDSRFGIVNSLTNPPNRGIFSNLGYGIRIFNTTSSINNGHYIYNNEFKYVYMSIVLDGAKYLDRIEYNSFGEKITPYEPQDNKIGIYVRNSYGFNIKDNSFFHLKAGICCLNNFKGSGLIRNKTLSNQFNGCYWSIYTFGYNDYLKIKCNRFNFDNLLVLNHNEYQYSWVNIGKLGDQGMPIDNSYPQSEWTKFPAVNLFDDQATVPLKLLHNPYQYPYYTYYYHLYTNNYNQALKPELAFANDHINLYPDDVEYNSHSCEPITMPPIIPPANLKKLNQSIDSLSAIYDLIKNNLDKGNTQLLLSSINSNSSSGQLKNTLLNNSLLSDQVLISTIITDRPKPLSPGNFKEVLIPNSPVSDTVRYYLDDKVKTLPPGISKQIIVAQGYNPSYITLTSIKRMIDQKESQKQIILGEYITELVNNDSLDKALNILNAEKSVVADQAVLATYIDEGDLLSAQSKINDLQSNPILAGWLNLSTMLIQLKQDSNTVFEIDSAQEQLIRTYAYNETEPLLASNAQAILRLIYGEEFPLEVPEIPSNLKISGNSETESISDTIEYLGDNIPNPFNNTTQIPYFMPDNYNSGKIIIYDIAGQKIKEYMLNKGKNILYVSLDGFNSGVYFYSIKFDGIIYQHKKMVFIKF